MTINQIINIPPADAFIFRDTGYIGKFKGSKTGTSDCNQFVPLHSVQAHNLLELVNGVRVMEYTTATITRGNEANAYSRYDQLLTLLTRGDQVTCFRYLLGGVPQYVYSMKGILMDEEGEVLMCIGLESNYVLNTDIDIIRLTPDKEKCVIFFSNDYCNNPKYKNLKKKLDTTYISFCIELGMDIIQTEKIDKWLYKNNFTGTKFKTVVAQMRFLKDEVPSMIIDNL